VVDKCKNVNMRKGKAKEDVIQYPKLWHDNKMSVSMFDISLSQQFPDVSVTLLTSCGTSSNAELLVSPCAS
jgi:hypothetical protein